MNLSQHFTLEELTASDTAARHHLTNIPNPTELEALRETAGLLEEVRDYLDNAVSVSSGLRTLPVNHLLGSKDTSAHVWGGAADFKCPGYGNPLAVAQAIADSDIEFDQLIYEFESWVHIGRAKPGVKPRRQVLTINSHGTFVGLHS